MVDCLHQGCHLSALTDYFGVFLLILKLLYLFGKFFVLFLKFAVCKTFFYDKEELIQVDRLRKEIYGPSSHRLHSRLYCSMTGKYNYRERGIRGAYLLHQLVAVHHGHSQICNDKVDVISVDFIPSLFSVISRQDIIGLKSKRFFETADNVFFIIHN